MAKGEITVVGEKRPCTVSRLKVVNRRVDGYVEIPYIWHKWYEHEGRVHALLEDEDGYVISVVAQEVKFCDDLFDEFAWEGSHGKEYGDM